MEKWTHSLRNLTPQSPPDWILERIQSTRNASNKQLNRLQWFTVMGLVACIALQVVAHFRNTQSSSSYHPTASVHLYLDEV